MRQRRGDRPEAGFTLIELMVAMTILAIVLGLIAGSLGLAENETSSNVALLQATNTAMLGLNQASTEIRDMSDSYDNSLDNQGDTGTADIITMGPTELQFLSGNNIVNNDDNSIVDSVDGGSFTTGCADEIDIKLVAATVPQTGYNLVQTDTSPTLATTPTLGVATGDCIWTTAPVTQILAQNIEPLCSGSACLPATPGAAIFSYLEFYPNQATTVTTAVATPDPATQVGEVTMGFAAMARKGTHVSPVVLTENIRLAAVLADPSS